MLRASLYLGISGLIWFAEGFLFSTFLAFSVWQTAILGGFYLLLFGGSLRALQRRSRQQTDQEDGLAVWRIIALAPMLTTILGSFVSLPLVLLVLAMGKL